MDDKDSCQLALRTSLHLTRILYKKQTENKNPQMHFLCYSRIVDKSSPLARAREFSYSGHVELKQNETEK